MSRFYRSSGPRYGVKKRKACLGGCGAVRNHDSAGEAVYCDTLKMLKKYGEIDHYETQKQYPLHDKLGNRHGFHKPDFLVFKGKKQEVHEFKNGLITKEWELKAALFTWCYPEISYIVKTPRDFI